MGVLTQVLETFSGTSEWFTGAIGDVTNLFYAENSLTFLGVLAIAGLSISVAIMLINMVKSFIRFK